MLLAADDRQNPRPAGHWRLMTNMLAVAAGQVGHPISVLILVVSGDRLFHESIVHDGGCVTKAGTAVQAAPRQEEIANALNHQYQTIRRTAVPPQALGTPEDRFDNW